MKPNFLLIALAALTAFSGCKKDSQSISLETNTWSLSPDDGFTPEKFKLKSIVLRTNVQQVLEVNSEDNAAGGNTAISSSMTLFFPTVGPPPSGTYKVTSFEKLKATDQVAVYVQTYGDPRTGSNITGWFSREGDNQTISYKFENGKASAVFKDIIITQTGNGPQTGKVSAKISQ